MSAALIWCPFADEGSAELVAARLLEEGLIACVNILPAVRSLYLWEGGKHEAAEVGALFKTHATLLDRAVARLVELHPYEAPSVIGWRADAAAPPTAAWLAQLLDQRHGIIIPSPKPAEKLD